MTPEPEGYGYTTPGYGDTPSPHPSSPEPSTPPPPRRSAWDVIKETYGIAPVTVIIVALTVAAWLGHEALLKFANINSDLTLGDPESAIHGDWWRLVTPMLVHFGLLHLGMNMFVLWRLGPPVERVLGTKLFLVAYLASGVGGQIASDVFTKAVVVGQFTVWPLSGGASGAIYGVIGVLIGYYAATRLAEKRGRVLTTGWRFNPAAVKSLAIQGTIWLVIAGPLFHVDSAAHAGGGLIGILVGAAVGWSRTGPPLGGADSHS